MGKYKSIEKDVIKYFNKNYSVSTIAKKFEIQTYVVYYILKKNHIVIPKSVHLRVEQLKAIKADYKKGLSFDMLSRKYKIEKTRLFRIFNADEMSETKKQLIINLHRTGNFMPSIIAQKLSITTASVRKVIEKYSENKQKNLLDKVGLTKEEIRNIMHKITLDNVDKSNVNSHN